MEEESALSCQLEGGHDAADEVVEEVEVTFDMRPWVDKAFSDRGTNGTRGRSVLTSMTDLKPMP